MRKLNIVLDRERCCGNGSCAKYGTFFKVNKDGKVAFRKGKDYRVDVIENLDDGQVQDLLSGAHVCPVNAIMVRDNEMKEVLVGGSIKTEGLRVVAAEYDDDKEFVMDPLGYFLIRTVPERGEVEVGFCPNKNEVTVKIFGRSVRDIYHTVIRKGLVSRLDHAAYLGREVQKAFDSMGVGVPYIQDDEFKGGKQ